MYKTPTWLIVDLSFTLVKWLLSALNGLRDRGSELCIVHVAVTLYSSEGPTQTPKYIFFGEVPVKVAHAHFYLDFPYAEENTLFTGCLMWVISKHRAFAENWLARGPMTLLRDICGPTLFPSVCLQSARYTATDTSVILQPLNIELCHRLMYIFLSLHQQGTCLCPAHLFCPDAFNAPRKLLIRR